MDEIRSAQIDDFIVDWYWDKNSYAFAFNLCAFLFGFMDYLESLGLSERTIKTHSSNCWHIGILECQYGYNNEFKPGLLLGGPSYLYEFKRKMGDSKYAVDSYCSTWRKLGEYVKQKHYLKPITVEEEDLSFARELYFFSKRLEAFETKLRTFGEWKAKNSLKEETKSVFRDYLERESSRNTKHYIRQINKCLKALEIILNFLPEFKTETLAQEKESLIEKGKYLRVRLVELVWNLE